jgi:hypothetical protein
MTITNSELPSLKWQYSILNNTHEMTTFIEDPGFWLSISVNLAGTGLFLSRVHHPPSAKWFGIALMLSVTT